MSRGVERKRTVIEVSKITFTVVKSRRLRLRETECNGNLSTGYTPRGIKMARTLFGLFQGTGEAML